MGRGRGWWLRTPERIHPRVSPSSRGIAELHRRRLMISPMCMLRIGRHCVLHTRPVTFTPVPTGHVELGKAILSRSASAPDRQQSSFSFENPLLLTLRLTLLLLRAIMAGHYSPAFRVKQNGLANTFQNGIGDNLPVVTRTFQGPSVSGFMRPVRFEGEINNLEVIGEIPKEIDGTFYRVMPEPQFPAFIPNDPVGYLLRRRTCK